MTATERTEFLLDLRTMLNRDGCGLPAPWSQVPEKYQTDFRDWLVKEKPSMWGQVPDTIILWAGAWSIYQLEYLRYKLEVLAKEVAHEG